MLKANDVFKDYKIFKILFVAFCILNCFMIYAVRICRPNELVINSDYNNYIELHNNDTTNVQFKSNSKNINGFILSLDKNSLFNDIFLRIDLKDENNTVLETKTIPISNLDLENNRLNIEFDQKKSNCLNKTFKLEITMQASNNDDVIKLFSNENGLVYSLITSDLTSFQRLFILVGIVITVTLFGSYIIMIYFKFSIIKFFCIFAILFGTLISLLIPVGNVPDEQLHLYTAYHYSNILLGYEDDPSGIYMRECDNYSLARNGVGYSELQSYYKSFIEKPNNTEVIKSENESLNVGFYGFTYIPQAIGLTLGRMFNLGSNLTFFLGRIMNFIFYLLISILALKIIPKYKLQLFFVQLMPMTLQQVFSLSYDAITLSLSFLIFSFIVKIINEIKLTRKENILLFICTVLLFLCKQFAYCFIAISPYLLLLFKNEKIIDSLKKRNSKTFTIILVCCVGIYIVLCVLMNDLIKINTPLYFIFHPLALLKKIDSSLITWDIYYFRTLFTGGLGTDEIQTPDLLNILFFALLCFIMFSGRRENKRTLIDRMILLLCCAGTIYGLIYIFQTQTPLEWGYIWGIQGRYFIPILLPFIFAISDRQDLSKNDFNKYAFLTLFINFVIILNLFYTRTIM